MARTSLIVRSAAFGSVALALSACSSSTDGGATDNGGGATGGATTGGSDSGTTGGSGGSGAATGGSAGAANGGSGVVLVCTQDLTVPLGVNIIENGGFEEGTTGWNMEPWAGAVSTLTSDAHSGSAAVEVQAGLTKTIDGPLTCDVRYTLRAWVKKPLSHTNWAGFGVDFLDANGEEVGEMSIEIPAGDEYKQVFASKLTPAGTASASLWVWGDGRDGLLYLDDIELVGTPPPSSTGGAGGANGGDAGAGGADGGASGASAGGGAGGG